MASDKVHQREFGHLMGIVEDSVAIPEEYQAITDNEAKLLAEAASHTYIEPYVSPSSDGYFTHAEMTRVAGGGVVTCNCSAHQLLQDETIRQRKDDIRILIRSKEPLTDVGGKLFATAMVRMILDFSGAEGKSAHH